MHINPKVGTCPAETICPLGTWQLDLNEDRVIFSSSWKRIVSYEEITVQNSIKEWLDRIHNEDREIVIQSLNKIQKDGREIPGLNYRLYTKDNIYKWMRCSISTVKFDGLKPVVIAGIQQDIDEFRGNEEFLNEINLKFGKLIENFSGGILFEDENRKVFYVNEDFRKYFNISESLYELIGTDCSNSAEQNKHLFVNPGEFENSIKEIFEKKVSVRGQLFKMKNGTILERDYIPITSNNILKGHLWLYRDVSKLKENEEKLEYRLQFEELITKLSLQFINLEWDNIDKEIDEALGKMGEFISADRSYVFQFSGDRKSIINTHEWVTEKVNAFKESLYEIPTDSISWWIKQILNHKTINLNCCEELPEEAAEEKRIFELRKVKSLIVVPMIYKNETLGFVGFDSIAELKEWKEDTINLLNIAASVITGAIKRKEFEEAIIFSEAKYKSVVNSVKEVIFQTDAEGLWTFLNPSWTEITGFSLEESLGTNFLNYVYEDDRERNLKLFEPLIKREKDYCRHHVRYNTKDGGFRWIEVFARLTLDENDNVIGTSGTLTDVTERKKSEEEIRKLSRAVETTPSAILLANLGGKIVYVNPGLMQMGNYSDTDQLIGKSIFKFTNEYGIKYLVEQVIPSLMNGSKWFGEIELKKSDGTAFPAELVCSVVDDENGEPQYLLANFYDITNRKLAEEEIKNALRKEKELNELKSKFVSMVSHEFRTPLAAILSSSDLLELYWEKLTAEKRDSLLVKIKKSITNLIDLLNDVTEINRADAGKTSVKPEEIEIIKLIEEILEELESGIAQKPSIHFNVKENSILFQSDKKLLRHIFVNLISNAVKYTPAEKNVYIDLLRENESLIFSVKDEGIGIPEEDFDNLFQPFSRSRNTGKIKGTGLGLSILKRSLDLLHGSIDFKSKLNVGSQFTVSIPQENSN